MSTLKELNADLAINLIILGGIAIVENTIEIWACGVGLLALYYYIIQTNIELMYLLIGLLNYSVDIRIGYN